MPLLRLTRCTAHLPFSLRPLGRLQQARKCATASRKATCLHHRLQQVLLHRQIACCTRMAALAGPTFFLDDFAIRQWDDDTYSGSRISYSKEVFVKKIHEHYENGGALVPGYAPFCKHIFVPNFVGAKLGALPITDSNRRHLQCGYSRRRPEELAVLTRWFCASDVEVPDAKYLDIILYSRQQLLKEYEAMPKDKRRQLPDAPWGIISVKAQDEDHETPMQPITIMRNSLGVEEGGSGVPLDRAAYEASVAFWAERAAVVQGNPAGE